MSDFFAGPGSPAPPSVLKIAVSSVVLDPAQWGTAWSHGKGGVGVVLHLAVVEGPSAIYTTTIIHVNYLYKYYNTCTGAHTLSG